MIFSRFYGRPPVLAGGFYVVRFGATRFTMVKGWAMVVLTMLVPLIGLLVGLALVVGLVIAVFSRETSCPNSGVHFS